MKQRGEEGEKDESLHEKARQREVEKEGNEPSFFFFFVPPKLQGLMSGYCYQHN